MNRTERQQLRREWVALLKEILKHPKFHLALVCLVYILWQIYRVCHWIEKVVA